MLIESAVVNRGLYNEVAKHRQRVAGVDMRRVLKIDARAADAVQIPVTPLAIRHFDRSTSHTVFAHSHCLRRSAIRYRKTSHPSLVRGRGCNQQLLAPVTQDGLH